MVYSDGTAIEIGDTLEINEEGFEPELAQVIKLGKKRIHIEWENTNITPRKAWVDPKLCELISREI